MRRHPPGGPPRPLCLAVAFVNKGNVSIQCTVVESGVELDSLLILLNGAVELVRLFIDISQVLNQIGNLILTQTPELGRSRRTSAYGTKLNMGPGLLVRANNPLSRRIAHLKTDAGLLFRGGLID